MRLMFAFTTVFSQRFAFISAALFSFSILSAGADAPLCELTDTECTTTAEACEAIPMPSCCPAETAMSEELAVLAESASSGETATDAVPATAQPEPELVPLADYNALRRQLAAAREEIAQARAAADQMESSSREMMERMEASRVEMDRQKQDLQSASEELVALREALADRESRLEAAEQAQGQAAERVKALEERLENEARALRERAEALDTQARQQEAASREMAAALTELREHQRAQEQAESTRRVLLSQPGKLVKELLALFMPEDRLLSLQSEMKEEAVALIPEELPSASVERRIHAALRAYDQQLISMLNYDALKEAFMGLYLEQFSPEEIYAIVQFYRTSAGSKLLDLSADMNRNLEAALRRDAREALYVLRTEIANATSPSELNVAIEKNLELIRDAGMRYLEDNLVREVNVAQLISSNYLSPIEPIDGERYSDLRIRATGGALAVTASDGRRVYIRY